MQTGKKTTTIQVTTILLVVVLIAAIAYYFKEEIKKLMGKGIDPDATVDAPFEAPAAIVKAPGKKDTPKNVEIDFWSLDKDKVLKKGSYGNEVAQLQNMINTALKLKKLPLISVDKDFGNKTLMALKYLTGKTQITLAEAATLFINAIGK